MTINEYIDLKMRGYEKILRASLDNLKKSTDEVLSVLHERRKYLEQEDRSQKDRTYDRRYSC